MTKLFRRQFIFIILLLSAPGCADEAKEKAGHYAGIECPRLELESFDDCEYTPINEMPDPYGKPETLQLYTSSSVADFCLSSCNRLHAVAGQGSHAHLSQTRDLALLKGIKKIGIININDMDALRSLHGLEDLEEVQKDFTLLRSFELENLKALRSLKKVGGIFHIQNLKRIKDLQGLESLSEVERFVSTDNDNLEDITALRNLEYATLLAFSQSPNLPVCQVEALRDRLDIEPKNYTATELGSGECE